MNPIMHIRAMMHRLTLALPNSTKRTMFPSGPHHVCCLIPPTVRTPAELRAKPTNQSRSNRRSELRCPRSLKTSPEHADITQLSRGAPITAPMPPGVEHFGRSGRWPTQED